MSPAHDTHVRYLMRRLMSNKLCQVARLRLGLSESHKVYPAHNRMNGMPHQRSLVEVTCHRVVTLVSEAPLRGRPRPDRCGSVSNAVAAKMPHKEVTMGP